MNGDFFNSIGVAGMEKVHSAVIGWMFSDKCNALNIQQKSILLCGLFDINPIRQFKTYRVEVEHHNIDIIIITDEQTHPECWVIENKIKSSQHSNQLDKYVDVIQGNPVKIGRTTHQIQDYQKMTLHFCFLTLISEQAQCSKCVSWINKTYKEFANLFCSFNLPNNINPDSIILNEYLQCINTLANALDDFLINHQEYSNVFTDGAKQKNPKLKTNAQANGKYAAFIADNGLETIFQKCFLSHIMNNTANFKDFSISETHGVALAEKTLQVANDTVLGIQFQNGAFKVQAGYPETMQSSNTVFWQKWTLIFPILRTTNSWKINESKQRVKPYFSFSQQVKGTWYAKQLKDIAIEWDGMYNACLGVLQELEQYC